MKKNCNQTTKMSKSLLIISLLFLTYFAKGQSWVYHPFPTINGTWTYQYYDDFHNPTGGGPTYVLNGDTIISSLNYKKMHMDSNYAGALRESGKIIYFYPDTASTEYVLYNFNLNVGDTIIHPFGGAACSNDTVTVTQMDSVLTQDGYRKQWYLSSMVTWIEGIGSNHHLLRPMIFACLSGDDQLECMVDNSVSIFINTPNYCFTSVPEETLLNDELIYPNPTSQNATLKFDNTTKDNYTLTFFDNQGRLVQEIANIVSDKVEIERQKLSNGIYFYRLQSNKRIATGKFIIE